MANYLDKMKTIGDEIAATGKVVDEDEMVGYILNGLDFDYNPVVSSILGRTDPITMSDLYAQLLSYETRLEMLRENNHDGGHYQSSVNSASRGRGGRGRNPRGRGQGGRSGGGRGSGGASKQHNRAPAPPKFSAKSAKSTIMKP